jgi:BTB/POZ domain-containing adapter for CUL3-mediated RhoA degradation protein
VNFVKGVGEGSCKMSGDQRTVIKGNPSQYVKLNVGGSLYYTTIGTLTKVPETMLQAMFSGRMEVLTDSEGTHTIFTLTI